MLRCPLLSGEADCRRIGRSHRSRIAPESENGRKPRIVFFAKCLDLPTYPSRIKLSDLSTLPEYLLSAGGSFFELELRFFVSQNRVTPSTRPTGESKLFLPLDSHTHTHRVAMTSGVDLASGADHEHDHVLRPRPRKPQHSQLRQLTRMASDESDDKTHLTATPLENGHASGATR